MLRSWLIAWHFLTAVPLTTAHHDPTPRELARSMGWFPLVGLLLGGLLAVIAFLLSGILSQSVVDALLIVVLAMVTRGLHLDGLADFVDGLAGGRTPAGRLAIMRDPRIGAMGAIAVVLALGLRYVSLGALPQSDRLSMLLCMPAVGRWAMVVGCVSAPYARTEGGLARPFLDELSTRDVMLATLCLIGPLAWGVGLLGMLIGCAVLAIVARTVTAIARRLLGGISGDTIGATNEITEVFFLIVAPILAGISQLLVS